MSMDMDLSFYEVLDTSKAEEIGGDVPPGRYHVMIEKAARKTNKELGSGSHLLLEMVVTEGEYEGRKLFHRINCWHTSEKARTFAVSLLKGLCLSIWGQDQMLSSADVFLDKFCTVIVKLGKEFDGERRPEVKEFVPLSKWKNVSVSPKQSSYTADNPPPF